VAQARPNFTHQVHSIAKYFAAIHSIVQDVIFRLTGDMRPDGSPLLSPPDLTPEGVELWLGQALSALWGAALDSSPALASRTGKPSAAAVLDQPLGDGSAHRATSGSENEPEI
jgi:hypothetical protein